MSRNYDARLERLERRSNPPQSSIVIWRTIVEVDGSTVAPDHYKTHDGKYRWEREPNESTEDFDRRVLDHAERIAEDGTVLILPVLVSPCVASG